MTSLGPLGVLVTGASGFVGQRLVTKLRQIGLRVVPTDIVTASEIIALDICEEEGVENLFKMARPDVVVHLAARVGGAPSLTQSRDFYVTNVLGTLNICEAATRFGVKKIVYTSSLSVYGNVKNDDLPITEETAVRPTSPYGASKACGEIVVREYGARGNMEAVILRPTTIYGPMQTEMNPVQTFLDCALTSRPIELYGGGNHTREFLFVDDAVDAIIAAIRTDRLPFDKFLISTGQPIALSELANKISMLVGDAKIRNVEPSRWAFSHRCDTSRTRTYLRWNPRVSLEEGLSLTLRWRKDSLEVRHEKEHHV